MANRHFCDDGHARGARLAPGPSLQERNVAATTFRDAQAGYAHQQGKYFVDYAPCPCNSDIRRAAATVRVDETAVIS